MNCANDTNFGPVVVGCRDDFDFTIVFEQSILSIAPSVCFTLISTFRIAHLCRQPRVISSGQTFLYLKLGLISAYSAVILALLILTCQRPLLVPAATSIATTTLLFVDSLIFLALSGLEHARSLRPSILLSTYLLLSGLFDIVQVRTLWLANNDDGSVTSTQLFTASLAFKLSILLLESQSKLRWMESESRSPEVTGGIFSLGLFAWMNGLIWSGYRKVLSLKDLYPLDHRLSAVSHKEHFQTSWNRLSHTPDTRRLLRTIWKTLKWQILAPILPRIAFGAVSFCQPLLINALLKYLESPDGKSKEKNIGYGFIGAAALIYISIALVNGLYWYLHQRLLSTLRACLVAAIYETTLALEITNLEDSAAITHMSSDVMQIQAGVRNMHEVWANLIEMAVASWLLYTHLGAAFVAPLIVVLLCYCASWGLGRFTGKRQGAWMKALQKRTGLTAAVVSGLVSIKLSGMAKYMTHTVQKWRKDELSAAKRFRLLTTGATIIAFTPGLISPVAAFGATSRTLSTSSVFTSLAFVQLLCNPLNQLLQTFPQIIAAKTSLSRVHKFLESRRDPASRDSREERADVAAFVQNGEFGWERDNMLLKDVSLVLPAKKLTVVTGKVASGKSTLLKGLIGEVPFHSGQLAISCRKIAFCEQTPYLWNGTIRENIIGYEDVDEDWYAKIIQAVGLGDDLDRLPQKDGTKVGSNGASLSGGQRQRVALARAVYSRPRLAVLDDCMTGLDRHTETQVIQRLFGPDGLFVTLGTSVVLATRAEKLLELADHVLCVEDGTVHALETKAGQENAHKRAASASSAEVVEKKVASSSSPSISSHGPDTSQSDEQKQAMPKKLESKTRQKGDKSLYLRYFAELGVWSCLGWSLLGLCFAFLYNFGSVWLEFWSSSINQGQNRYSFYLGLYILIQVVCLLFLGLYVAYFGMSMAPSASAKIHLRILRTVMAASLPFLSSIDAGSITNHFSQDISVIDNDLSGALSNTILTLLAALGQAAVIASASVWVLIGYPILVLVLALVSRIYLRTSRQLRLLELEAKAPLYTHFLETLGGLPTIRAFGWTSQYTQRCDLFLDDSQRPLYLLAMLQQWLTLVLNMVVAVLAIAIVTLSTQVDSASSGVGFTGVGLVSLMTFGEMLANLVRIYTMLEVAIGAISRLTAFATTTPRETDPAEGIDAPELATRIFQNTEKGPYITLSNVHASYE